MAVSKNNPAVRDNQRLVIKSPKSGKELRLVKRVPGGMFYVDDSTGEAYPVRKGSYRDMPHEWIRK